MCALHEHVFAYPEKYTESDTDSAKDLDLSVVCCLHIHEEMRAVRLCVEIRRNVSKSVGDTNLSAGLASRTQPPTLPGPSSLLLAALNDDLFPWRNLSVNRVEEKTETSTELLPIE